MTPLNFDIPALTVTMPAEISIVLALTVTFAAAVIVIPLDSSLTELPLLWREEVATRLVST